MTSIGWRLGHICGWTEVYRNFTFGPGGLSYAEVEVPGTADAQRVIVSHGVRPSSTMTCPR